MDPQRSNRIAAARKAGRWLLVVGMLLAAVAGGVYLGTYLLHEILDEENLARGAAALGVAAVLAMIKEAVGLLPGVVAYLKTGKGEGLYKLSGFAVVTAATVTFSVPTLTGTGPPPVEPPPPTAAGSHVLFLSRGGETSFVVPFFEEAEVCATEGTCETGLRLDDSTSSFLATLVGGLVDCGSPGAPVKLQVRGFASSSRFEDRDDSDALNMEIANRRAGAIVTAIESHLATMEGAPAAAESLDMVATRWSRFDAMAEAAGFNDRDAEGAYSELRGLLNRRAEIRLLDPAGCEVAG